MFRAQRGAAKGCSTELSKRNQETTRGGGGSAASRGRCRGFPGAWTNLFGSGHRKERHVRAAGDAFQRRLWLMLETGSAA